MVCFSGRTISVVVGMKKLKQYWTLMQWKLSTLIHIPWWARPTIDIRLNLGFVEIQTAIYRHRMEMDSFEYITIYGRFLKYDGSFRWYETGGNYIFDSLTPILHNIVTL